MRFIFLSILLLQGCSSGALSLFGGRKMISCSSSDSSKTTSICMAKAKAACPNGYDLLDGGGREETFYNFMKIKCLENNKNK